MTLDLDITLAQGCFTLEVACSCSLSVLGIYGPSGCGKTTLVRAIAGLSRPQRGHIRFGDRVLFDAARSKDLPPHRRGMGLVFQDARLFPHRSVDQNLRAGECIRRRTAGRPYSFEDVVDLLDIAPLIHRRVGSLSGGEAQRVAMGRALLSNPRLLLMDEPVSGLDPALKAQILPFLLNVHHALGIPAVVISHQLEDLLALTPELLLLEDGRVAAAGHYDLLSQPGGPLDATTHCLAYRCPRAAPRPAGAQGCWPAEKCVSDASTLECGPSDVAR